MKRRWLNLWLGLGAQGDLDTTYDDLVKRYNEPRRAYHTLVHIKHCLSGLDLVYHLAREPDAMAMAFWYHDAIYDAGTEDNEEKSAELAAGVMRAAALSEDFVASVVHFIDATQHIEVPEDFDTQLFTDIDLSILGQPESRFNEYELQVRREYHYLSWDVFAKRRASLLRFFLERGESIYSTEFFRDRYEERARQNITRSLKRLEEYLKH